MVSLSVIEKICDYLDCQPGDILENVKKEKVIEDTEQINKALSDLVEKVSIATGKSIKEIFEEGMKYFPEMLERAEQGNTDLIGIEALKKDMESKE